MRSVGKGYCDGVLAEKMVAVGLMPLDKEGKPATSGWGLRYEEVLDGPCDMAVEVMPRKAKMPWMAVDPDGVTEGGEGKAKKRSSKLKYTCPTCEASRLGRFRTGPALRRQGPGTRAGPDEPRRGGHKDTIVEPELGSPVDEPGPTRRRSQNSRKSYCVKETGLRPMRAGDSPTPAHGTSGTSTCVGGRRPRAGVSRPRT